MFVVRYPVYIPAAIAVVQNGMTNFQPSFRSLRDVLIGGFNVWVFTNEKSIDCAVAFALQYILCFDNTYRTVPFTSVLPVSIAVAVEYRQ
jgi:hypothetical protein